MTPPAPTPLARALELAHRGWGEVEPNPCVGAVLVRDGVVVGEGWHHAWGAAHAEVVALREAGERARGATLFVTLEPCSTAGKTPPCSDAVVAAGVARTVVGATDPNPAHAGRGLHMLEAAGVAVERRDDPQCLALAEGFAAGLRHDRPHVFAKFALSSDGALAGPGGEPVHLTGARSDARVHHWRAHLDGVLVGVQTVVNDDPLLTPRGHELAVRPLRRVVLDPSLRVPLTCRLVQTAGEIPTWVLAREDADQQPEAVLEAEGVRVLRVPGSGDAWLGGCLATLRLQGVQRLMVEGGAHTLASFLGAGLVDQVAVFQCPQALGPGALPVLPERGLAGLDAQALARALELTDVRTERLGDDLLVRGRRRLATPR